MGRINWGRVFLGGLLAGVVINVGEFLFHAVLFKDQMAEAMRALGKDPEVSAAPAHLQRSLDFQFL